MMSSECALVISLDVIIEVQKGLDWFNWFSENQYQTSTTLVCSIVLNMSQQNHSHLVIIFYNHHNLYSVVHISSIKSGTEVVEGLS